MADQKARVRVSIFARLLTIMILMAVTLLVIVATFFVFFVFPGATAEAGHAFEQFSRGVAASSPDYSAAQALASRVHVQIRYEGPRGSWATNPHVPSILDVKQGRAVSFLGHEYHIESAADGGSYLFVWDYGEHVRGLHAKMLWLLLFLVVGVVCTAYVFQRRLLRPVRLLDEGVTRLSTGDLNVAVPVVTRDEFGVLTDTFNKMVGQVKQMIQARDQLLLDVSHELRSPLTRLKVALALLPDDENKNGMVGDLPRDQRLGQQVTLAGKPGRRGVAGGGLQRRLKLGHLGGVNEARGVVPIGQTADPSDEFGALTDTFNKMVGRVKQMIQARDQLLLDVSHELRSPLTRLKVALALLPDDENRAGMVGDLNEMEAMITELLELERMREGRGLRREGCDLAPVLRELADVYNGDPPGVRLLAPPEIWLDIDREKIRIVLRNLLENARKFSLPDSGPVEITVETDESRIILRVRDDGPGIPESDLPNLFEPFYRVDRSRSRKTGGYGLGLSICKRIMEAHGGSISVSNNPGRGASFVLVFNELAAGKFTKENQHVNEPIDPSRERDSRLGVSGRE